MTDNGKESTPTRTEAEDHFLAECLLAFDQAQGKINMTAVAQAMGFKNVGSAVNKFAQFKKKFNIDIRTFHEETKAKRLGTNESATPKKATPKHAPRKKAAPPPKESDHSEEDGDKTPETGSPSA